MHLPEQDFALLQQIGAAQADGPLRVDELAKRLGLSASALVRRAKALQNAGWLQRRQEATPHGRAVYYLPMPRISVEWVSPHGVTLAWSMEGRFEMDFPLTTQIPDPGARSTVRRLLWAFRKRGLLDAEYHDEDGNVFESGPGLALVVYGSTARGAARHDSDVDVLVVLGERLALSTSRRERKEAILDAAAQTSLDAARSIQASVVADIDLPKLPKEIRRAVETDGLIVFDALHDASLWKLVYGRRSP